MKKHLFGVFALLLILFGLSGCNTVGNKATSLTIIYWIIAFVAFLLLIGCCLLVRKNKKWFTLLFSSILVANFGYAFLSVSTSLEIALLANRICYLGSVFLPLSMLMIILNVTNTPIKKWVTISLFSLSVITFLIAATPGILPIYYRDVSFAVVDGVATLIKEYGPFHTLYLFYLLGYFTVMVIVIIRASVKKTIDSTYHSAILAIAVFANIGVYLIEQFSSFNFEMLSISYIITELFLLGVHLVTNENQRLKELIKIKDEALQTTSANKKPQKAVKISVEAMETFTRGLDTLTPTERTIYDAHLSSTPTKEIMSELNIKENTLKFHNKNIYSKLGVSSRKQLLEIYKAACLERKM